MRNTKSCIFIVSFRYDGTGKHEALRRLKHFLSGFVSSPLAHDVSTPALVSVTEIVKVGEIDKVTTKMKMGTYYKSRKMK